MIQIIVSIAQIDKLDPIGHSSDDSKPHYTNKMQHGKQCKTAIANNLPLPIIPSMSKILDHQIYRYNSIV